MTNTKRHLLQACLWCVLAIIPAHRHKEKDVKCTPVNRHTLVPLSYYPSDWVTETVDTIFYLTVRKDKSMLLHCLQFITGQQHKTIQKGCLFRAKPAEGRSTECLKVEPRFCQWHQSSISHQFLSIYDNMVTTPQYLWRAPQKEEQIAQYCLGFNTTAIRFPANSSWLNLCTLGRQCQVREARAG